MTSAALDRWHGERSDPLDELFAAHALVGGTGVGRRWRTGELNRALLLRMAAQFQGFAKDLHQEAAIRFGSLAQPENQLIAGVVASAIQAGRELDRGNAREDALKRDFDRFGFDLWDAMDRLDQRTPSRRQRLRWLNVARNALAHDDEAKLQKVLDEGYRMDLSHLRSWRRALNGIAGTMDHAVGNHLERMFGVAQVW